MATIYSLEARIKALENCIRELLKGLEAQTITIDRIEQENDKLRGIVAKSNDDSEDEPETPSPSELERMFKL